ncbi:MAG: hypothetical protein JRH10_17080 [Deltaproteobacteria bacterium]|nr:hypothetical protein [Deltaproteobacteria bacterium]
MPRRFFAYVAYLALVAAAFAVAAADPLLFQKLNTVRPVDGIPDLSAEPGGYLDIEAVLRPIPLHGRQVWNVLPETRHRRTMIEGGGNCSQISFGFAYQLERQGIDYQIIHMFTPAGLGLGDGHTVIRVPFVYEGVEHVGLVDMSFGGLLVGDRGMLDVADVDAAPVPGWSQIDLNAKARFPDYHDNFLVGAIVGYVPSSEIRDYYAFIERVYLTVGADMAEKFFFDGLALLFGRLPEVYVPRYDELVAGRDRDLKRHRAALAGMRSALFVVPMILAFELLLLRRRWHTGR